MSSSPQRPTAARRGEPTVEHTDSRSGLHATSPTGGAAGHATGEAPQHTDAQPGGRVLEFPCSRRALLKGLAVATAATASGALLAACGSEDTALRVAKADIPVGGAVFVDNWVVAQPTAGTFTAFSRTCPHASAQIDKTAKDGDKTVVVCPKHGSTFDISTGAVIKGPARDPLTPAASVTPEGNLVEVKG